MIIVKLNTPWPHDFYSQTPNGKGIVGNFKFEINNGCNRCDWWIIWGGIRQEEDVDVLKERIIYITDEAHNNRVFNESFLQQFDKIASVRTDLTNKNVVLINEIAPWYFNKSYDDLLSQLPSVKIKGISVISSDLTWLPGHKKRFAFVNKLIGHFKDKIDVFGRGFNEVLDKYENLIYYKYSIAIENNCIPGYFTEKISDCYLTYTMPVYYGAPDIEEFYDKRSLLRIDIDNYKEAFQKIEELIYLDPYTTNLPFITESRIRYFENYHVFAAIIKLIQRVSTAKSNSCGTRRIKIFPENTFLKKDKDFLFDDAKEIGIKKAGKIFVNSILRKFT